MAEEGVAASVATELTEFCDNSKQAETVSKDDEVNKLLANLSSDYAEYLCLDLTKEQKQLTETADDLLAKLDEYLGFADLIRSDVNLTLQTTLSAVQLKSKEMEKHFERIDKLEAFMTLVKRNVGEMELMVDRAESDLGTLGSIRKVFHSINLPSLFTPKSQQSQTSPSKLTPKFEPPRIFKTDDYFKSMPETHAGGQSSDDFSSASLNTSGMSEMEEVEVKNTDSVKLPSIVDDAIASLSVDTLASSTADVLIVPAVQHMPADADTNINIADDESSTELHGSNIEE